MNKVTGEFKINLAKNDDINLPVAWIKYDEDIKNNTFLGLGYRPSVIKIIKPKCDSTNCIYTQYRRVDDNYLDKFNNNDNVQQLKNQNDNISNILLKEIYISEYYREKLCIYILIKKVKTRLNI